MDNICISYANLCTSCVIAYAVISHLYLNTALWMYWCACNLAHAGIMVYMPLRSNVRDTLQLWFVILGLVFGWYTWMYALWYVIHQIYIVNFSSKSGLWISTVFVENSKLPLILHTLLLISKKVCQETIEHLMMNLEYLFRLLLWTYTISKTISEIVHKSKYERENVMW